MAAEVSKHLATKDTLNETNASHAAVLDTLEQEKSSHITTKNELSENKVSLHEKGIRYIDWSNPS